MSGKRYLPGYLTIGFVVVSGLIFFAIIFFLGRWQTLSNISNIGLFITTLLTLIIVWQTYEGNKLQDRYLRTLNMISRITGGSELQGFMSNLLNKYSEYYPLLTDPDLANQLNLTESQIAIAKEFDAVFSYFEELGMYVEKELLDWDLIYAYFMIEIPKLYELYSAHVDHMRKDNLSPEIYEYFQKLNNKILTRKAVTED